jgi:hypothetical protein
MGTKSSHRRLFRSLIRLYLRSRSAMGTKSSHRPFPFELTAEVTATCVGDLAKEILRESDRQVAEKDLYDAGLIDEFTMACDALNAWRMFLRLMEELGQEKRQPESEAIFRELCRLLAQKRGYEQDDFQSALDATSDRARLPWGYTSLRLAYRRAKQHPIRLLHPDLADSPLPTLIAGIAYHLVETQRRPGPVLLPVDKLRALLRQRKLVVGGAILRLIQAKLLEQTSQGYSRGRAREFKFGGREGTDFEFVTKQDRAESAEKDT